MTLMPNAYAIAVQKRIRRLLLQRRFHAFCIGAAKTGTTTVAAMLKPVFLAAHEPETILTNRLVIGYMKGQVNREEIRRLLRARDRRLRLEMDSSHPLGYLAPNLQELFPNAKFVVTVREPTSWLRSRINFHDSTNPPKWKEYRQYFWHDQNRGYAAEETILRERGLVSLDTYLEQYAAHYRRLIEQLDWDRACVIKTSELSSCAPLLAGFLGICPSKINLTHDKRGQSANDVFSQLDPEFVKSKVAEHCSFLSEKWFPEVAAKQQ
jgi:hypothetical protein